MAFYAPLIYSMWADCITVFDKQGATTKKTDKNVAFCSARSLPNNKPQRGEILLKFYLRGEATKNLGD